MPRFDLMRTTVDRLRAEHSKDGHFLKAVLSSAYGLGFYAEHAVNYARTLLDE